MSESAIDSNFPEDAVLRLSEIPIAEKPQLGGLAANEDDVGEPPNVIDTFNPSVKHTSGSEI